MKEKLIRRRSWKTTLTSLARSSTPPAASSSSDSRLGGEYPPRLAPFTEARMLAVIRLAVVILSASASATASPTQLPLRSPHHSSWTSLGPFPLGSREGPLLPPLLPIDRQRHPSPLADGGFVETKQLWEDDKGWVHVGEENVR
jgi:hypothetical protein